MVEDQKGSVVKIVALGTSGQDHDFLGDQNGGSDWAGDVDELMDLEDVCVELADSDINPDIQNVVEHSGTGGPSQLLLPRYSRGNVHQNNEDEANIEVVESLILLGGRVVEREYHL